MPKALCGDRVRKNLHPTHTAGQGSKRQTKGSVPVSCSYLQAYQRHCDCPIDEVFLGHMCNVFTTNTEFRSVIALTRELTEEGLPCAAAR